MKESIELNDFDTAAGTVNTVVDPLSQVTAGAPPVVVDPNPPSPLSVALETAPNAT